MIPVSIHAPRAGCDRWASATFKRSTCFNSRTPCGVRLGLHLDNAFAYIVSIHAPRAGCDSIVRSVSRFCISFNSRTPCGVRQHNHNKTTKSKCFNSRTPCGVRQTAIAKGLENERFNSRTPCGVRLSKYVTKQFRNVFQFTHPVRGATADLAEVGFSFLVSIHAPRAGCDPR